MNLLLIRCKIGSAVLKSPSPELRDSQFCTTLRGYDLSTTQSNGQHLVVVYECSFVASYKDRLFPYACPKIEGRPSSLGDSDGSGTYSWDSNFKKPLRE